MERPQERHPARDRVVRPFETSRDDLNDAYIRGYQKGKQDASLSWGGKFWVAVVMVLVGFPLLLAWIALVTWLVRLL